MQLNIDHLSTGEMDVMFCIITVSPNGFCHVKPTFIFLNLESNLNIFFAVRLSCGRQSSY